MNEAMLSFFNRIRVCPYPDIAAGAVVPSAQYGDLPIGAYAPGGLGVFSALVFPTTRLSGGWLELFGVKSVSPAGMDANMQKIGHQQSPGNVEQMAPGRMGAMNSTVVFNYNATLLGELWALVPGGLTAPAYPALDAATPADVVYVSRAKGRLLWEFEAPDGCRLRTLGSLSLPTPFDAPDDSAPMTTTAMINGSGRPVLILPNGALPG